MIRYTFRLGTMDQVKGVCLIPTYTHPLITSGNRGKYIIIHKNKSFSRTRNLLAGKAILDGSKNNPELF